MGPLPAVPSTELLLLGCKTYLPDPFINTSKEAVRMGDRNDLRPPSCPSYHGLVLRRGSHASTKTKSLFSPTPHPRPSITTPACSAYREVAPDGKVLRLDVAEVEAVGEVIVKMAHHVQEAEGDVTDGLGLAPLVSSVIQGEESCVVGTASRQVLYCVEVATGAQHRQDMVAQVLQETEVHVFLLLEQGPCAGQLPPPARAPPGWP